MRGTIGISRLRMSVLACLVAMATSVGSTSTAIAATPTCSGSSCTGKDPAVTHCADDSYVVPGTSRAITWQGSQQGVIQILWSPRCQSNWGRIVMNSYDPNPEHLPRTIHVYNDRGGDVGFIWSGPGQYIYGDMLYSPACAWATGDIDMSFANAFGTTGRAC